MRASCRKGREISRRHLQGLSPDDGVSGFDVYERKKSRKAQEFGSSETAHILWDVASFVSEVLPDSFSLFTALIFCAAALIAVLISAARLFVRD
jgi:hypothetical protein